MQSGEKVIPPWGLQAFRAEPIFWHDKELLLAWRRDYEGRRNEFIVNNAPEITPVIDQLDLPIYDVDKAMENPALYFEGHSFSWCSPDEFKRCIEQPVREGVPIDDLYLVIPEFSFDEVCTGLENLPLMRERTISHGAFIKPISMLNEIIKRDPDRLITAMVDVYKRNSKRFFESCCLVLDEYINSRMLEFGRFTIFGTEPYCFCSYIEIVKPESVRESGLLRGRAYISTTHRASVDSPLEDETQRYRLVYEYRKGHRCRLISADDSPLEPIAPYLDELQDSIIQLLGSEEVEDNSSETSLVGLLPKVTNIVPSIEEDSISIVVTPLLREDLLLAPQRFHCICQIQDSVALGSSRPVDVLPLL